MRIDFFTIGHSIMYGTLKVKGIQGVYLASGKTKSEVLDKLFALLNTTA